MKNKGRIQMVNLLRETGLRHRAHAALWSMALVYSLWISWQTWHIAPLVVAAPNPIPAEVHNFDHTQPVQLRGLAAIPFFGRFAPTPVRPPTPPPTPLALQLRAVFVDPDPALTSAVIADGNGPAQTYTVEATLPGGAVLQEITATYVVLLRAGQYETLGFPQPKTR